MTQISAHADYKTTDYRFERVRSDRLYVPLEPSPPPLGRWSWLRHATRWDIAVAVGVILLMCLALPVSQFAAEVMEKVWP